MDEQNRSLPDSSADPNQISGEVSAFHSAWEIEAQARRKAELAERERQKKEAEAQYQAREEYAKTLADEKVDLIRLKQGVITVDELNLPEEEEKHYTVWQKIGNWFYHAKWWLGIAVFCVLVGAFLIYDYVTRVDADVRVLLLTDQQGFYTGSEKLNEILSGLVADCNGDGRQIVQSTYIPVNSDNMEHAGTYSRSYNSQLLIQFQSATSMLVIADADAEAYLRPEEMFEDMQALYPDCPFAEGVHIWRIPICRRSSASRRRSRRAPI